VILDFNTSGKYPLTNCTPKRRKAHLCEVDLWRNVCIGQEYPHAIQHIVYAEMLSLDVLDLAVNVHLKLTGNVAVEHEGQAARILLGPLQEILNCQDVWSSEPIPLVS
jgi:hypothetical protein